MPEFFNQLLGGHYVVELLSALKSLYGALDQHPHSDCIKSELPFSPTSRRSRS
jgi:hypothetical protein